MLTLPVGKLFGTSRVMVVAGLDALVLPFILVIVDVTVALP